MPPHSPRPPVLFLSHGAPPLADDPLWARQLQQWGSGLEKPSAVLMISAHWEDAPVTISASDVPAPLVHDFWGFPEKYYRVRYDAPVAPGLARSLTTLVGETGEQVRSAPRRGLDHGAYVPLVELFPRGDVPTLQMSMPTLDPRSLMDLGRRLAPLRDEGVLIIGSGFATHNLAWFNPNHPADAPPPQASREFDAWAAEAMQGQDIDALLDFQRVAPAAQVAHPRTEHWAPLYLALGAATGEKATCTVDGFWYGLSKRSWQLG